MNLWFSFAKLQIEQNDRMHHKTLKSCSVHYNHYMRDYCPRLLFIFFQTILSLIVPCWGIFRYLSGVLNKEKPVRHCALALSSSKCHSFIGWMDRRTDQKRGTHVLWQPFSPFLIYQSCIWALWALHGASYQHEKLMSSCLLEITMFFYSKCVIKNKTKSGKHTHGS